MSAIVTVQYPNKEDAKFDNDYYVATHMPLVEKAWGPRGLKTWYAVKNAPENQFVTIAVLIWDSLDNFKAASSDPSAKHIFDDIPNFTNIQPIITTGEIIGKN